MGVDGGQPVFLRPAPLFGVAGVFQPLDLNDDVQLLAVVQGDDGDEIRFVLAVHPVPAVGYRPAQPFVANPAADGGMGVQGGGHLRFPVGVADGDVDLRFGGVVAVAAVAFVLGEAGHIEPAGVGVQADDGPRVGGLRMGQADGVEQPKGGLARRLRVAVGPAAGGGGAGQFAGIQCRFDDGK